MSFNKLKQNRKEQLAKLQEATTSDGRKSFGDERYWTAKRGDDGRGVAVIRFLPEGENDDFAWIRYYNHWFKGKTGKYYVEKSLSTLDQPDPVGEYNSKLWNSGDEKLKKIASRQKRGINYVSNIYVIKDSLHPENEGKVFLYRYGPKIYNMIKEAMNPPFDDDDFDDDPVEPINPFDLWEGADFILRAHTTDDNWVSYDRSKFKDPSPLLDGDDAALEEVYNSMHTLKELIAPDQFKSYAELAAKLQAVCGEEMASVFGEAPTVSSGMVDSRTIQASRDIDDDDDDDDDTTPYFGGNDDEAKSAESSKDSDMKSKLAMFQRMRDED